MCSSDLSIDVTAMVLNGVINTRVLAMCRDLNIDAVGLSGVDAGLVRAHKRPPADVEVNTRGVPKFVPPIIEQSYCTSPAALCAELAEPIKAAKPPVEPAEPVEAGALRGQLAEPVEIEALSAELEEETVP